MSRGLALFLALAAVLAAAQCAPAEDKYTDKYDNINLDEILNNERLYRKYLECLLADSDGRCTADGKELRRVIPDALLTDCVKCTDRQKSGAQKVIKHLRQHRAHDWNKLQAKWDPQGVYVAKHADLLR